MANAGTTEVGRISIKVMPDTDGFRTAVRRQMEQIEAMRAEIDVKVNLDVVPAFAQFRALLTQMRARGQNGVDIIGRFRMENDRRGIGGFGGFGGGSGGGIGSAGGMLTKIKGAPWGMIAAVVAAIAAMTPVIGFITTAMLTLPGLIAAVAAPVAALALGMDGLKKAATVLKAPLETLKTTLSNKAQEVFTPILKNLATHIPRLTQSLPLVTEGLGAMANAIVKTVTSETGIARINTTIQNIATALKTAAPGIGDFTDGFLTLAARLSQELPNLSTWFNGAGKSFKEWITSMSKDGTLQSAFQGLGSTLKTILETIGTLAQKGMEFMKDPEKIQSIITLLERLGTTLSVLASVSDVLFSPTERLVGLFERLPSPLEMAKNAVQGLIDTISRLTGIDFGNFDFEGALRNAFSGFPGIGTEAITGLISAITGALPGVDSILSGLKDRIINAIPNPGGLLTAAGAAIIGGLKSGIESALPGLFGVISGIAPRIAALKGPLPYDRQLLIPNGLAIMFGLQKGIEQGTGPVLQKAQALAGQIAAAVAKGGNAASVLGGMDTTEIGRMHKALESESDRVEAQLKALNYQQKMAGNDALKGEVDKLNKLKEQIDAQKEMVSLAGDYNKETKGSEDDPLVKAVSRISKTPMDFGAAVGKQFMSDLGISGDGLIPTAINETLDYAKGITINVGSVDEAMAAQQTLWNKQALAYTRR